MTEQERDPLTDAGAEDATGETEVAPADEVEQEDEFADDEVEGDEDEGDEDVEAEPERPAAGARGRDRHPAKAAPVAPSVSELAVHVSDRGSAVFVLAVVGVFVVILLYGMLLGHNGFLTNVLATPKPAATPTPIVTPAPTAEPSVAPSSSAAPSAVAPSPSATSSIAPSPSATSSAAPSSAAPSPSAS